VNIKAGDCSVSVHLIEFELFLQITKIVTESTQEETEIATSALFFYSAGVKISEFLSTFVYGKEETTRTLLPDMR